MHQKHIDAVCQPDMCINIVFDAVCRPEMCINLVFDAVCQPEICNNITFNAISNVEIHINFCVDATVQPTQGIIILFAAAPTCARPTCLGVCLVWEADLPWLLEADLSGRLTCLGG